MASSSFSDAPDPDTLDSDAKSVTIVINDNGEINYDEKTLQSIIGKIFLIFFDKKKYLQFLKNEQCFAEAYENFINVACFESIFDVFLNIVDIIFGIILGQSFIDCNLFEGNETDIWKNQLLVCFLIIVILFAIFSYIECFDCPALNSQTFKKVVRSTYLCSRFPIFSSRLLD